MKRKMTGIFLVAAMTVSCLGRGMIVKAEEMVQVTSWTQFSDPNSTDRNHVAFYNALELIKEDMPNVEVIHEGTEAESYKVKFVQ